MNPHTQDVPDTYVWEVPGKAIAVHMGLSAIERLSAELMRGYGANPKRNAEVGGVLIGSVEPGTPTIVRVEDFEVVPCQYRRGPSYVFTEEDCEPFEKAGARPDAVGYFRSHTREGFSLSDDDVELLDHFFTGANTVALLVKPYATKAGVAGFFIRENGKFPASTPLEFPFRRQELTGAEPPARRSMMERGPRRERGGRYGARDAGESSDHEMNPAGELPFPESSGNGIPTGTGLQASYRNPPLTERNQPSERYAPLDPPAEPAYAVTTSARSRMRSGWVWIPLSFVFLLLGVALGFQAALFNFGPRSSNSQANFSLSLVVSKTGQNLSVHWDRQAPAVCASKRGVLEIEEKGITKPVDLDSAQLQNGTLTYRNVTNDVHFRLTVFPTEQVSVMEAAEWRQ